MAAAGGNGGILERAHHALTALGLALLAGGACDGAPAGGHAYAVPGERAENVTVEVLNATGRAGLARGATGVLRRAGIDVVFYGNAGAAPLDSTRILIRRGTAATGERIRRALGTGVVVVAHDSTLLLDASVLLGADFRSPRDFHP